MLSPPLAMVTPVSPVACFGPGGVIVPEDTATRLLRALFFTWKVPSASNGQDPQQALSFQAKGTFSFQVVSPANSKRKPEANNPLSAQYPPNIPPMTTASKCRVPFAVASSQVLHTNQGDIAGSRSGRSSRFI